MSYFNGDISLKWKENIKINLKKIVFEVEGEWNWLSIMSIKNLTSR